MKKLMTTDNSLVGIAYGRDMYGKWYVQTTDFEEGLYLSESIIEGVKFKFVAKIIANAYAIRYGMQIFKW